MTPRLVSLSLLVAAWFVTPPARADDDVQRRALVDGAVRARDAGNHANALALAQSAEAMRPTSSLTRFIAEEHETLGHLPEAFDSARRCLRLAESEEPSANHDAVLVGCRTIETDLRPRLAFVSVSAPGPLPAGLVVRVGGAVHDIAAEPVTVVPGTVRVEARAPGWLPFATSVDVAAGAEASVILALAAIPPPAPPPPSHRKSLLGPVIAGAGVVALATSGVAALVANGEYDNLHSTCSAGCPDGAARRNGIQQLDTVAVATAVGGGVLLAVGATLFLLDHSPDAAPTTGAWLQIGPSGAAIQGRF